jgi:CHAT domain-containing protein
LESGSLTPGSRLDTEQVTPLEQAIVAARQRLDARDPPGALMRLVDALQSALQSAGSRALGAAELIVAEQMADLASLLGEWPAADALLTAIEEAARNANALEGADYACLKRAHIHVLRADLDTAREVLSSLAPRIGELEDIEFTSGGLMAWERAIFWRELGRDAQLMLLSRAYLVFALMLMDLGQYPAADAAIVRGLVAAGAGASDSVAADAEPYLRLARVRCLIEQGALAEADRQLEEMASKLDPKAAQGLHVQRLELSARAAQLSGRLGSALDVHDEICRFCAESGFTSAALTARLNRAHIWIMLNQTRSAEAELDAAERLTLASSSYRDIGRTSAGRIGYLRAAIGRRREGAADHFSLAPSVRAMQLPRRRRSRAQLRRTQTANAPAASSAIAAMEAATGDVWVRFEARANAIEEKLRSGETDDALALIGHVRANFGAVPSPLLAARVRLFEGIEAELRADPAEALDAYRSAARDFERLSASLDLWRAERCAVGLAARHPAAADAVGTSAMELATAADKTLEAIAETLPPEARAIYLLDKSDAAEDALRREVEQLMAIQAKVDALPFFRRWLAQRRPRAAALEMLRRLDRARSESTGKAPQQHAEARLPAAGATLVFVSLPDGLFTALLTPRRITWRLAEVSRLALRDLLAEWHLSAQLESHPNEGGATSVALQRLADAIGLAELVAEIGPRHVRRLRIIADDVLHGAPFAALPLDGMPLVQTSALSLASRIWPQRRTPERQPSGPRRALLVAIGQGGSRYSALPNAAVETQATAAWLAALGGFEMTTMTDDAVEVSGVKAALSACAFAHVVCHGAFEMSDLARSGLVLRPDREPPHILSLAEIFELDLSRLDHVTLSACWAADNYILPGRRVISLPGALAQAGAGTILAAMWKVSDAFAPAFMQRFYELAAYMPKVDALARVQRECHDGSLPRCAGIDPASPYLWAGFTIYGDDGEAVIGRKLWTKLLLWS